jgi:hypothetical protein
MMNNKSSGNSGEDIVLNPNGETYNPISLNPFVTQKLICCLIGIPLNVTIAVTILRHRRLRCKPRNIFLLGITLSFLTFFIPAMIELVYRILLPIDPLCRAYVAFVGLPHGLLLFNMSLALTDRFVAINYPLWHREKMTIGLASCFVVFGSTLIAFVLKFVFIVGLATLRCEMVIVHVQLLTITVAILLVLCTALNVIVYRQTKTLLRESRIIRSSSENRVRDNNSMSIHVNGGTLSQMGMEATRTLITGVTSLVVTAFLGVLFALIFLACRLVDKFECSHLNWDMGPYFKELGLIPAVYSPIVFLVRNKELRTSMICKM